jgi:hypothetical protein
MGFLRFIFILLLVVPVAVLMLYFVNGLSNDMKLSIKNQKDNTVENAEAAEKEKRRKHKKEKKRRSAAQGYAEQDSRRSSTPDSGKNHRSGSSQKAHSGSYRSSGDSQKSNNGSHRSSGSSQKMYSSSQNSSGSSYKSSGEKDYLKDTPYYRRKQEMKASEHVRSERMHEQGTRGRAAGSEKYTNYGGSAADTQKSPESKRKRRKQRKNRKKAEAEKKGQPKK